MSRVTTLTTASARTGAVRVLVQPERHTALARWGAYNSLSGGDAAASPGRRTGLPGTTPQSPPGASLVAARRKRVSGLPTMACEFGRRAGALA
jgi:hypothetical protein